jgi:hypothetical protein
LDVRESSPAWKKTEYYQTASVELPVAALAKANPPQIIARPNFKDNPVYGATVGNVTARLEQGQKGQNIYHGTLWLKNVSDPTAVKTKIENVIGLSETRTIFKNDTRGKAIVYPTDEAFWHSDGTAPEPSERAYHVQLDFPQGAPTDPIVLEIETTRTQTITQDFAAKGLKIPVAGAPIEVPAKDGSPLLKKLIRVTAQDTDPITLRTGGKVNVPATGALLMVFELKSGLTETLPTLLSIAVTDDKGNTQTTAIGSAPGNVFVGGRAGQDWSVLVAPPALSAKTINIKAQWVEKAPTARGETIRIGGIDVASDEK